MIRTLLLLILCAASPALRLHAAPPARRASPSPSMLAEAARKALLSEVDGDCEADGDRRTVEAWLGELTRGEARRITWSGGRCGLVMENGIDGGSRWCGQATIQLKHPKSRQDTAVIEIFFEAPMKGRPGKAYAIRGLMRTPDGPDISRFVRDFEADWHSRFPNPDAEED